MVGIRSVPRLIEAGLDVSNDKIQGFKIDNLIVLNCSWNAAL